MASCFLLPSPSTSSSSFSIPILHLRNHKTVSLLSFNKPSNSNNTKSSTIQFQNQHQKSSSSTILYAALTDSSSSSSDQNLQPLLQGLSNSFAQLPPDYLAQLPNDLRMDLNDAAFDLSSGPVFDECGPELGEALLNLSQAWEVADTSTSCSIANKLPSLAGALSDNAKSAFGKRLVSSGRRFQSMGSYGQGELQRIAKAMIETGKLLSATPITDTNEEPKVTSRMFKFGELQVAITSDKANIGAAISLVFAIITWELGQGIQNIPESSLQYANDNALLLAKSLRGALLVIGYGSAILSAFATVGLILLGRQLKSDE